ncbi:hypothetical protein [Klebsiella pneumoniae]|uniref:DinB/UmuC family translesion DNA polymerase n=1 Tax=Klebsiella pneumoniae TaxID=573 RepID=UPI003D31FE12
MAITGFAARAGEKLRQEKQHCRAISVFIRTSPFSPRDAPCASRATDATGSHSGQPGHHCRCPACACAHLA